MLLGFGGGEIVGLLSTTSTPTVPTRQPTTGTVGIQPVVVPGGPVVTPNAPTILGIGSSANAGTPSSGQPLNGSGMNGGTPGAGQPTTDDPIADLLASPVFWVGSLVIFGTLLFAVLPKKKGA
jgi:hypothetical protein